MTNELTHYGVKGMKWGVSRAGKVRREASDDHVSTRSSMKKRQSQMTTAELKRVNERLQLERTNRDLQTRGALQKIKTGTAVAGTILAVGTTMNAAIQFTRSPAGKAVIDLFKK